MTVLAEDVAAFDQRGCLSPSALYVVGGGREAALAALDRLAEALEARARRFGFAPRIPPGAASAIVSLRAIHAMDSSGRRRARFSPGLPGWTLLFDEDGESLHPTPGWQTLFVHPIGNWDALPTAAAELTRGGGLQAIGIAPDESACPPGVMAALRGLGLSRVCALEQMQSPPLDWAHDGNPFFPWRVSIAK